MVNQRDAMARTKLTPPSPRISQSSSALISDVPFRSSRSGPGDVEHEVEGHRPMDLVVLSPLSRAGHVDVFRGEGSRIEDQIPGDLSRGRILKKELTVKGDDVSGYGRAPAGDIPGRIQGEVDGISRRPRTRPRPRVGAGEPALGERLASASCSRGGARRRGRAE